jgi:hypothetical protein
MTTDMNALLRKATRRGTTSTVDSVIEDVSAVAATLPPARLAEFGGRLLAVITEATADPQEATR